MSLESQDQMARDESFKRRVKAAMAKAAADIVGEAAATEGRDERHALGVAILYPGGFDRWVDSFARMCAANGTIAAAANAAAVPDGDIEFVVITVWNDIAGVKAA